MAAKKKPASPRKKAAPKKKAAPEKKPAPKKKSPRDHFSALVTAIVREALAGSSVRRERGEFALRVKLASGEQSVVYLASLFAETREMAPEDRARFLHGRLSALLTPQTNDDWDEVAPRLVPTLRAATFGLHVRLANPDVKDSLLGRAFVPYVDLRVAIDDEQSLRYATRANLEKWKKTQDEVVRRALLNAEKLLAPPSKFDDTDGPMFAVAEDDDYQSSRLAVPGLLASFAGRVEGRPIAIVPERSQLYVAGDARPSMVERLADMAGREWSASTRAISPAIYTVDRRGHVIPYRREEKDALAHKITLGHVRLALREYAEQKEVLDQIHERDGVDVFVATLNGIVREDGRPITWCLWGQGIESLLPRAEIVTLDGGPEDARWHFHVPFGDVARIMEWTDEEGLSPPRVRPKVWPDGDHLAQLRSCEVRLEDLP